MKVFFFLWELRLSHTNYGTTDKPGLFACIFDLMLLVLWIHIYLVHQCMAQSRGASTSAMRCRKIKKSGKNSNRGLWMTGREKQGREREGLLS